MKKYNGSISIYFVFAIILIISVIMSVTEIARMNCQKLYLQIATDSGLDSMASLYHRDLYEYYNLYGVEYRTKELLESEYLSYIEPYISDGDGYINNWYVANIDEENIDLEFRTLIEETYLEKEILNYMKFKLLGNAIEFLGEEFTLDEESKFEILAHTAKAAFEETEKGSIYGEVHDRYFDFSRDIMELENYAKKIEDYVDKVNTRINNVKSMSTGGSLNNGKSALAKFDSLNDAINNLKSALTNFRSKMGNFREKVNANKSNYEADKEAEKYNFTEEVCEFIESEFSQFLSYVDADSPMNKAVERGFERSNFLQSVVANDRTLINEYVVSIEQITLEIESERKKRGEDHDSDLIRALIEEKKDTMDALSECLKELKQSYKEQKVEPIAIPTSTRNHDEEENLLHKLIGFKNGILLNLVLESDAVENLSKENVVVNAFDIMSENNAVSVDKVILGEYELDKFNYFNKDKNDEITMSGSTAYEVERLISGKKSDYDNLSSVINKILLIRIAMNVLYIYTHPEKRDMVRQFTMSLFAGFSILLAEAMFLVVLTAWGTAQAIADVKKLLSNKRVSFMHTDSTWTVSLNGMLDVARGSVGSVEEEDDSGFAFNYKDYLRLLLMLEKQSKINGRMVGIIENNIKHTQSSFDFEKLIYSFDVSNTFVSSHMFTNFVFVEAKDTLLYEKYKTDVSAYRCFYDD